MVQQKPHETKFETGPVMDWIKVYLGLISGTFLSDRLADHNQRLADGHGGWSARQQQ
jgi:hypothetical protein